MQYIDRHRVPPPPAFQGTSAKEERDALLEFMKQDPERRAQSSTQASRFEPDSSVLSALHELFNSKCAFCEARVPLNVHLFRPKEEATPQAGKLAHLYYIWLRTDWGNFYSICGPCSARTYRNFPVKNGQRGALPGMAELEAFVKEGYGLWRSAHRDRPLLIDPCRVRDYTQHFSVSLDGRLQPISEAAVATIEVFGLDRDPLVRARAQAYDQYLDLFFSELARGVSLSMFDFDTMEFGGSWYLLLRRLGKEAGRRLGRPFQPNKAKFVEQFRAIWGTDLGQKALREAAEGILLAEPRKAPVSRTARRGPASRLTTIEVENFKAISGVEIVVPEPIAANPQLDRKAEAAALLILGENAAGKSSLLEAVALALCSERTRTNLDKAPSAFILDPSMLGVDPDVTAPSQTIVSLGFDDGGHVTMTIRTDYTFDQVVSNLPLVFAYGAFRQYDVTSRRSVRFGHVGSLFQPRFLLPNPEKWLLGLNETRFAMVARALRDIFSIEGEFEVIEQDRANARCLLVTRIDDGNTTRLLKTPLAVASSGYRSILAMVCDILEGLMGTSDANLQPLDEARPVILIDEIEAHLHPRWKMQIMTALRQVLPRAVIVATSHDPLCIRGMHDGEVAVFRRGANGGGPDGLMAVEVRTDLPDVENLTVEQLLTSDLFEMFSTDSPQIERNIADISVLLARRESGVRLRADELAALEDLEQQIGEALPLGTSQAQRLVLSAVEEFLRLRRGTTAARMKSLEAAARQRIVSALESI
ncbi:MAG: AAA family ATPase [Candidatus Sphingomonas phytovorans]|nr:AAA family ATPase [Sphingomonas sp.]WEK02130.1 MAG: AAA family ATPase [Sphingomonas sp.]